MNFGDRGSLSTGGDDLAGACADSAVPYVAAFYRALYIAR